MHPGCSSVSQKKNSVSRDGLSTSCMMIRDKTSSSAVLIKMPNSPSSKPPKRSRSPSPSLQGVSLQSSGSLGSLGLEKGRKLQKIDSENNKDKLSNGNWSSCVVRKSSNAGVDKLKSEISKKRDSGKAKNLEKRRAAHVEEEQPKELDCEIKLFIETPEVHPSYEKIFTSFLEYHKKEYPGSIDEAHFQKLWKSFWQFSITKFWKEEYKTKKKCEDLIGETGYRKSLDEKRKENLSPEINTIEKDLPLKNWEDETETKCKVKLEKKCGSLNTGKGCIESQNKNQNSVLSEIENIKREVLSSDKDKEGLLQLNPSVSEVKENNYEEKETKFQKVCNHSECLESESSRMVVPWWMHSVTIINDACAVLKPQLSSLLKILFRKLLELGSDKSKVYQLLVERDSEFILSAVSEELGKMRSDSVLDCHKLKLACLQALKLLRYPRFALQVYEKDAMERDKKNVNSESSQLSINNKIEIEERIKLVTSNTSHKEIIHPKEPPNTEKSAEVLLSELYCSEDSLVLLEEMDSNVELMDSVASVLVWDIQTCWSDRSKLWELLGDIECQSILIHILDRANVLAQNTSNIHDSESICKNIVLTNKLLDLSRAITSKMDHTLKKESSKVGFCSHSARILHSQVGISSPCSLQIFPSPSPPSVFSNSSLPTVSPSPPQPPEFSSDSVAIEFSNCSPAAQFSSPSSQLIFSNFSPPTNSKGNPSVCESSNTSKDKRQILTTIGHSVSSKLLGLDHVRSLDGTGSHGLHKDISFTDEEFLSIAEVCSHIDVLGPIALTLLKEIRICWPDKARASDVLLDNDKQVLLELMSVKLKEMTEEATSELCKIKYQVASITISKLQDLRKSCIQKQNYFGLDLSKIARMTFNKGSIYTTQYIKSALFIEGFVNPYKDDLTRLFKAVSDLHFTMAVC